MTRLCEQFTGLVPEARAVIAGEHIRDSQAYRMISAMSWGTSLLAILVGVLEVMNTMLMTVFERRRRREFLRMTPADDRRHRAGGRRELHHPRLETR